MKRDGHLQSLWQQEPDFVTKQIQTDNKLFDVLIAGAGITGLTTALLLQEQGKQCVIAEANTIGFGTTLGTTAHLNNFFDTTYQQASKDFGEANAQLLYKGAEMALQKIKSNIDRYKIDCGYSEAIAYIFAVNEDQDKDLQGIIEGGKAVGLPINETNENPFPIPYTSIASVQGQAKFNPAAYITGLAKAFEAAGGVILEGCRVLDVKAGDIATIETSTQTLQAKHVIYATHIPPGINILHLRCAPYRSYAMAVKLGEGSAYPEDLGYDLNDPYYYYRSQEVDGEKYLIAGGEDHKTGHSENTEACFKHLESQVRKYFDIKEIAYKWSSQYFEPTDGLAYIGHLPGNDEHIYTATGFGGNGMTYGTLSAIILSDIILTGASEFKDLFSPGRVKPVAGFTNFVKENADVVKTFISGKFSSEKISALAEVAPGEGRLAKYDGKSIGLYKDEQGNIHAIEPTCPHMGCSVAWNSAEKTWDCPCHGARYDIHGKLLTGPSREDLMTISLSEGEV